MKQKLKLPIDYTTIDQRTRQKVRSKYCELQDWLCFYCGKDLLCRPLVEKKINWNLFPENFLKYPIHLQHNHETNMTEGAVHAYCNAVLWQYEGR